METKFNTRKSDFNRVVFYSAEDMAIAHNLLKSETILLAETKSEYLDINDILELYNIKKHIDNNLHLKKWTQEQIKIFQKKAKEYGEIVGTFISSLNDKNVTKHYQDIIQEYIQSFWELINNHHGYKRIPANTFNAILTVDPHSIYEILNHKNLVNHYDEYLKDFLITFSRSAEILLSTYEAEDNFKKNKIFVPDSLSIEDKENIFSKYLDSNDANLNYVRLIINLRNKNCIRVSDKTKLKAKRLYDSATEKMLSQNSIKNGISISFIENATKLKECYFDENSNAHYSYSLDYIKTHSEFYTLFKNFKILFEYVDTQNRISLVSKIDELQLLERLMGVRSKNEYIKGRVFYFRETSSHAQICNYARVLETLNIDLMNVLKHVYTYLFHEIYRYPQNAKLLIPSVTNSNFEKIRILAPEFESILKQFKLFVQDKKIDYELLQISSTPSSIAEIPSLNQNKYIYLNEKKKETVDCTRLLFSDQTLLTYVVPFKEKNYRNFFDLLDKESVSFCNYEEHQKKQINYLIDQRLIYIDINGFIRATNSKRLSILKDLNDNEVASFHRYPIDLQREATIMASENIILFESSLFSRPEQSYFNYFLNKSEFTNGLDLRNSYLHGTQATPEETNKHEYAYFAYLKLLFLAMLKIEDDLEIFRYPMQPT